MTSFSLQKQLIIRLLSVVTLLWLLGLLLAGIQLQQELTSTLDSALQETAERILPLALVEIVNREQSKVLQQLPALNPHDERLTYQVKNAAGQVLLQSHAARLKTFNVPLLEGFTIKDDYRIFTVSAIQDSYFIQVAEPLAFRRAAVLHTMLIMTIPLMLLLPLCLLLALFLVRQVIKPVRQYGAELAQRGAADLTPVTPANLPHELTPISQAVNHLLLRLQVALDTERYFTANAAHELRTPLATMKAQTQRLEKTLKDESARLKVAQLATTLNHLTNLSDKLLQLAKADSSGLLSHTPQDLNTLLLLITEEYRRAGEPNLQLQLPQQPVNAAIDADAFAILVKNLLENAIKHGDPDSIIDVRLNADGELRVINACQPLSAEQLQHLPERFYRASANTSGSGLGLAIVAALIKGVGGQLQLLSPASGSEGGFEVVIKLPLQA